MRDRLDREWARFARQVVLFRRVRGVTGRFRLARMLFADRLGEATASQPASAAVPVRLRTVRGPVESTVWVRPRSTDLKALRFSLQETDHLPPADLPGPLRRIAVFGANIGLLAADLADRHPDARVLGVEADADNAELARRNTARLGDRCRIHHAAVWHSATELDMAWGEDAWGVDLSASGPGTASGARRMTTVPVDGLLSRFADGEMVDYLLINIETAWWDLLRHGQWTRRVRALTVEIQDHYDEAGPLLRGLGFRTGMRRYDWGAFVTAVR